MSVICQICAKITLFLEEIPMNGKTLYVIFRALARVLVFFLGFRDLTYLIGETSLSARLSLYLKNGDR